MGLADKKCVPCKGGALKLDGAKADELLHGLSGWRIEGERLKKTFKFADFVQAMRFLNQVADVAEREQHHPDFSVSYSRVDFTIWTHDVSGLSENDFIVAAKIDLLAQA